MAVRYLKKAEKTAATGEQDVRATVQAILDDIEAGGEQAMTWSTPATLAVVTDMMADATWE